MLEISNAVFSFTGQGFFDLSGTYTVLRVSPVLSDGQQITLADAATVNPNWDLITEFQFSNFRDITIDNLGSGLGVPITHVIGPFATRLDNADQWICNFIAPNGVFQVNGDGQTARSVSVRVTIEPIDAGGVPIGPAETFTTTLTGSSELRTRVSETLICKPSFTGAARISAERITNSDFAFEGTISDEIIWRDLFYTSPVNQSDFGNITIVHSRTVGTEQAAAIADRELNLVGTREVPVRIGQTNNFTAPQASERVDDIAVAMAIDPFIGRRDIADVDIADVDIDEIYRAVSILEDYYGAEDAIKFSVTLDDDNISFEETLGIITSVTGLQFYRVGRSLKALPIIATDQAAMVFNHRNKMPNSDIIQDSFGDRMDIDGVRLQYIDDNDYVARQINIPEDESAHSPRTVTGTGAANTLQAYHMAWRARNSDKYQIGTHTFDAMPEAELLIRGQNILVADNTRSSTFDGEVTDHTGLELTLSQTPDFQAGVEYAISIQHRNKTVETVPIASHNGNRVTLSRALLQQLFIEDGGKFNPPYVISGDDNSFLRTCRTLTTRSNGEGMTRVETAVYTPLVHLNDGISLWFRDGLEDFGPFIASPNATALVANGVDAERGQIISIPDDHNITPSINQTQAYTFAGWFRLVAGPNAEIKATPNGFIERLNNGRIQFVQGSTTINSVFGAMPSNVWTHIAQTYDPVTQLFSAYVNGVFIGDAVETISDAGAVVIGNRGDLFVDDLRTYRRSMTAHEIIALFKATRT